MRSLVSFGLLALSLLGPVAEGVGLAQEAAPETPSELREFRLDPERAPPEPEQTVVTEPVVASPAAQPKVREPDAIRRLAPPPQARVQQSAAIGPADNAPPPVLPDTSQNLEPPLQDITAEPRRTQNEAVAVAIPETGISAALFEYWRLALAIGVIALLVTIAAYLRRRRNRPATPLYVETGEPLEPAMMPAPSPAPRPMAMKQPMIRLGFAPEKATISFTTLTIKGQLQLINEGDAEAVNMHLRVGLISASAQQKQFIEAFHHNSADVAPEMIGGAKPKERIGMAIELSVPLTEMQNFPLGDQQLLVPILVANLAYEGSDDRAAKSTQIACMIGREANPPASKMGPLRLDLGPRSFASLGQRLLTA